MRHPHLSDVRSDFDLTGYGFKGQTFEGLDLIGSDYMGSNLTGAHFRSCDLHFASFFGAKIKDTDFSDPQNTLRCAAFMLDESLQTAHFSSPEGRPKDLDQIALFTPAG